MITKGPWIPEYSVRTGDHFVDSHHNEEPILVAGDVRTAEDTRFIAAAGNAANELEEEYNKIEIMRKLPEMIDILEKMIEDGEDVADLLEEEFNKIKEE